jgi:isopentenyl diphosphate isomerase/L-lactate dehydrogenase-like FMN-dependent dehydrogenase
VRGSLDERAEGEGVEAAVRILERELQAAMAQTNCPSIKKITRDAIAIRDWSAPS